MKTCAKLCALCLMLVFGVTLACQQAKCPPESLTVVSYGGGAWQASHKEAFFNAFQKISGMNIQSLAWNAEYGKLKNDVASGRVGWDLVEVTAAQYVRGKRDNLFERLDPGLDQSEFVTGAIDTHGVANVYWATVIAYKSSNFGGEKPQTWRDFWDVQQFPGWRALYDDPRGNLEFALLADGVDPKRLYPLDVDRAFKSLDKIKPYIKVWWLDGSQPSQLLAADQVALSSAWNGRLFAARKDGAQVAWSWNGAAMDLDWWVVPKGAHARRAAERLIWYASQPYTMALQAEMVGYGPSNKGALRFISSETQAYLPTQPANFSKTFLVDSNWWADNESEIQRRWIGWKGK